MRISTSKSEAMVLSRKRVDCSLQVGGEFLPQVEEFKYLGILFTSEGRSEREIDRRIGAASAVLRALNQSLVVKRELSRKAKLSIYRSIYIPTLTYGHEIWVMTERTRLRIQAAEMSFLRRVAGLSLRDRVRSSVIREGLGVEPLLLHVERSQLRWCSGSIPAHIRKRFDPRQIRDNNDLPECSDPKTFKVRVGNLVFLKLLQRARWDSERWDGPYEMVGISPTAVKVDGRTGWPHQSQLCRFTEGPSDASPQALILNVPTSPKVIKSGGRVFHPAGSPSAPTKDHSQACRSRGPSLRQSH
ncbi:uncharacterized protein LOC130918404 [Corythoichthys intestinalis]|uniref:uncharacterized protein LOC130918404 n=1 Tax=Corythoichthys intestinalis TaxID=161448 RepID=UPI0025A54283|nr:uncharacterized protein LOC130918404 [Corythoichthys intestinalis]